MSDPTEELARRIEVPLLIAALLTIPAFSNLEGEDDQLSQHSVTFETNLEGRSMDELYEIALMVAKDTFWHEFTVSLGITVTYIPQVHAQHT